MNVRKYFDPALDSAFTLIELLVVITIIVVLLALLTPALDKAIYQAELAVCAAEQRSVSQGVTNYAAGNRRRYPHRPTLSDEIVSEPQFLRSLGMAQDAFEGPDDRFYLRGYVPLDLLNDPLAEAVDLSVEATDFDTFVIATRPLWYGWQFIGQAGMFKIGDRWIWTGGPGGRNQRFVFNYLTTDRDNPHSNGSIPVIHGGHPDSEGVLTNIVYRNERADQQDGDGAQGVLLPILKITASEWYVGYTRQRGELDMNFASSDGAVIRENDVERIDERMVRIGSQFNNPPSNRGPGSNYNYIRR